MLYSLQSGRQSPTCSKLLAHGSGDDPHSTIRDRRGRLGSSHHRQDTKRHHSRAFLRRGQGKPRRRVPGVPPSARRTRGQARRAPTRQPRATSTHRHRLALEAAGFRGFGNPLDRFERLFEYLKQRPFDPVARLVYRYLHGCVRVHVHTRVIGDDSETCTMFAGGLQAGRE